MTKNSPSVSVYSRWPHARPSHGSRYRSGSGSGCSIQRRRCGVIASQRATSSGCPRTIRVTSSTSARRSYVVVVMLSPVRPRDALVDAPPHAVLDRPEAAALPEPRALQIRRSEVQRDVLVPLLARPLDALREDRRADAAKARVLRDDALEQV